jgi:hypothetical protein
MHLLFLACSLLLGWLLFPREGKESSGVTEPGSQDLKKNAEILHSSGRSGALRMMTAMVSSL